MTFFGGVEYKFFLPNRKLVKLLQTSDIVVRGSTFPGENLDEQWVDHLIVEGITGEQIVDVKIRSDIASFDRREAPPGFMESVEVRAPWYDAKELKFPTEVDQMVQVGRWMVLPHGFHYSDAISFELLRIDHSAHDDALAPRIEGVLIKTRSVHLAIFSTSALEYYWADPHDYRALKYSHLDMEMLAIHLV